MNINVLNNQHKFKATHEDSVVSLDKYLYVQDKKNKYLLLRFYNGLTNDINAISFDVYFYAKGQVLGVKRMRDVTVRSTAQNCFYFPKKISIPKDCDSFAIDNISPRAGFIEYRVKDGQIEKAFYDLSEIPDTTAAINVLGSKHVETNLKNSYKTTRALCLMFAFMATLVIALLPLLVIQQKHDTCVNFSLDNIQYEFLDDNRDTGNIAVTGYTGTSATVVIPKSIEGLNVVAISDNAFANNTKIESVYIEGNVAIGSGAFGNCTSLTKIELKNVTKIGSEAFKNTAITDIDCSKCTYLGSNAFMGCTKLDSVKFNSDSPLTVGTTPFANCESINNVSLLQNITFENPQNTYIFGTTTVQKMSFKAYPFKNESNEYLNIADIMSNLKSLYIESIDNVPDYFCMNMSNLEKVQIDYIGNGSIGNSAFKSCNFLTSFSSSSAIKNVGDNSFNGTSLTEFNFDSLESVGVSAFENSDINISLAKCTKLKNIGARAFAGCKNLTALTLNAGVEIGDSAFANCIGLTSVSVVNLTTIPNGLFSGCENLSSVTFADNLEKIGEYAFENTAISKIELKSSVTEIGLGAFKGTKNLESYKAPFIGGSATENNYLAYVFGIDEISYIDDQSYPEALKYVTISNASKIAQKAFYHLTSLETVNIVGEQCTIIDESAFAKCFALKYAYIPTSIVSIKADAFSECKNLLSFTLPSGLKFLGDECFYGCSSLTSLNLDKTSLETIGSGAFRDTKISKFVIPATVTSIGKSVFKGCPVTDITMPNCISGISENLLTDQKTNKSIGYYFGTSNIDDNSNTDFIPASLENITINSAKAINQYMFYNLKNVKNINFASTAVTSIGISAFEGCSALTTIAIPSNVTIIHTNAFRNCGITSVTIPSAIERIDEYAFSNCSKLATVTFADKSTATSEVVIKNYAFENTGITSLTIPAYVNKIGEGALYGTSSLKSLTLPKLAEITSVDDASFEIATLGYIFDNTIPVSLDTINLTSSSVSIKSGLKTLTSDKAIVDGMFSGASSLTNVTLPADITRIGASAFYGCTKLNAITIPSSVTKIGGYAFAETSLSSITIGNSVTEIGERAFENCKKLTEMSLPAVSTTFATLFNKSFPDGLTTIIITSGTEITESMFAGMNKVTSITLPDTITKIGASAFKDCSALTSLVIPNNAVSIGKGILTGCSSLTDLTIPVLCGSTGYEYLGYYFDIKNGESLEGIALSNVTITNEDTIPQKAFYKATTLESVTLNNVTTIGASAFEGCTKLKSFTIPEAVTEIQTNAFYGCLQLHIVVNNSTTINDIVIGADTHGCVAKYALVVNNSSSEYTTYEKNGYKVINIGTDEAPDFYLIDYNRSSVIDLPTFENVTTYKVASYLFSDNKEIQNISVPNCVTEIGDYAFYGCPNITTLTFVSDRTNGITIGDYAFSNTLIEELILPNTLTSIGSNAFENSTSMYYVVLPNTLATIGDNAFNGCTNLYIIKNNSSLSTDTNKNGNVGNYAKSISKDDIKSSSLKNGMSYKYSNDGYVIIITDFNGTNKTVDLTSISTKTGLSSLNTYYITSNAFKGNTTITKVTIGKEIKSLPKGVFMGCTSLNEVVFEDGSTITSIPEYAFSGCTALTTITLPDTVTSIGAYAFSGCTALSEFTIPTGITTINESTFEGCTNLKSIDLQNTGVTSIGKNAFKDCTSVEWIIIPKSLTSIAENAFANCVNLYEINTYSSLVNVGDKGTENNGCIAKYAVIVLEKKSGETVTSHLGRYTISGFHFYENIGNWSLKAYDGEKTTSLVLPTSAKDGATYSIDQGAIDATGVTQITLSDNITAIEDGAFVNLGKSGTVYYNGSEDFTSKFSGWTFQTTQE